MFIVGQYLIQCGDEDMYWMVETTGPEHILTITTDIQQASVFSIIPSEETDENFDFSIGWRSKSLQDIIDCDDAESKESYSRKMMRYLEVKTFFFFGHYAGPLRMKSEITAKDSRLCLYTQRIDDNNYIPSDTNQWLAKKSVVFISSASKRSFIAVTRIAATEEGKQDQYKTKCLSSQKFHNETNVWMLFRLLFIDECASQVKIEQAEMVHMLLCVFVLILVLLFVFDL